MWYYYAILHAMFENIKIKQQEVFNEDKEEDFYNKADQLPDELANKWIQEYESLEDPEDSDFFTRFNSFLEERRKALYNNIDIVPETPEEVVNEIISLRENIQNEYGNPRSFLGEGRTAKVHIHPESPKVCIKYIKDADEYIKTDIPLYKEFMVLRDLQKFSFMGVRTPTPYFENTNGEHMYGMERIMGNTLIQIMEKPEENVELVKLARTLDRKAVLDNLIGYVKEMHNKFKVTHGDLEVINIMLGNDGNFYIIDFGKSKYEEIGDDHELYRDNDIKTIKSAIEEFFSKIDRLDIN